QTVNGSDEIAQQTHDLEDGLPLTEEESIDPLEIARVVRATRPAGRDRTVRRSSLIRGMIAVLTADLVEASRNRIEQWLEANRISTSDEFALWRVRLPGGLGRVSDQGRGDYRGVERFGLSHLNH